MKLGLGIAIGVMLTGIAFVIAFLLSQVAACQVTDAQIRRMMQGEAIHVSGCLASPFRIVNVNSKLYLESNDGSLRPVGR